MPQEIEVGDKLLIHRQGVELAGVETVGDQLPQLIRAVEDGVYPVRKGTVLYLALEDDYSRLQKRLYQMFGTESTENLYFSVSASQLGSGLDEQLQNFVREHPDNERSAAGRNPCLRL